MEPLGVSLAHCLPEFILGGGALFLLFYAALRGKDKDGPVTGIAVGLIAFAMLVLLAPRPEAVVFGGALIDDGFARFMKLLALAGALVSLVMGHDFLVREKLDKYEFPILVLLAATGMMALISAQNLIALYLGLELMSLSLYVIAAFNRDDVRATEAGLKYFVLGALSSGMLLYGASLIYGFCGSVSFSAIAAAAQGPISIGLVLGLVFLLAGLAFKMSAAPFHMWTPDVYEGAPTPVTAFFASAVKMAAVAVTVRVAITAFPGILPQWRQIIVFVAILSMALGAFAAIGQANIKRLMAYSAIGHVGFALVGLAAGTEAGVVGVMAYMAIYLVMTLGSFALILSMRIAGRSVEQISDLSGLARTDPTTAFFFAMLMFSMAGIPPLAGFFAKWYVFNAAIQAHLYPLAVIGVLSSAVAAYYYLRIVKIMYFDDPSAVLDKPAPALRVVLAGSSLLVLFLFAYPGGFIDATTAAAKSLF